MAFTRGRPPCWRAEPVDMADTCMVDIRGEGRIEEACRRRVTEVDSYWAKVLHGKGGAIDYHMLRGP